MVPLGGAYGLVQVLPRRTGAIPAPLESRRQAPSFHHVDSGRLMGPRPTIPAMSAGTMTKPLLLKGWTMRTNFDFSPLLRSSIGFENLNRLLDIATRATEGDVSFPPYNIEKLGADAYRITMAVAGFTRAELDITVQENTLVVTGKAADEAQPAEQTYLQRTYLHRGIAKRAFERRFQLADVIKVTGASFENGLLNIDLQREVPEHKKPRKVEIGETAPFIEGEGFVEGKAA